MHARIHACMHTHIHTYTHTHARITRTNSPACCPCTCILYLHAHFFVLNFPIRAPRALHSRKCHRGGRSIGGGRFHRRGCGSRQQRGGRTAERRLLRRRLQVEHPRGSTQGRLATANELYVSFHRLCARGQPDDVPYLLHRVTPPPTYPTCPQYECVQRTSHLTHCTPHTNILSPTSVATIAAVTLRACMLTHAHIT